MSLQSDLISYLLFMYYQIFPFFWPLLQQSLIHVPPVHTHHRPRNYSPSQRHSDEIQRIYAWGYTFSIIFHCLTSLYVRYFPAFSKINQNRSFCSVECDSQSVSPSPPWAGQLSLFFKLKHDLLRILTCDKLYTLLITCQLERWNCAF